MNPRIEEEEFINKLWLQNCGDSLKVIEKTNIQDKNKRFLFRCQFQKYFCEVLVEKQRVIRGTVLNPYIEENNFIGKIIPQHCGDSLKIVKKSNKYDGKNILYECEFINYPSIVYERKNHILEGEIINPALPWKSKESLENFIINNFERKPTLKELCIKLNISESWVSQLIIKYQLQNLIQYFVSEGERDIRELCIKLNNSVEQNPNLTILKGQEIDIYISNKKLGIEFNGNLWHSNHPKFGRLDYLYHQNKSLLAQKEGIQLIHIWEWEWKEKREILENLIRSKLGVFNKKIGASKCKIKILSNQEYQEFCNKNHLQGSCGAKIKLGLWYKNELVQIMSFGVPRFSSDYQWEVIRECSKLGYCVIGGKQKLWNYFLKNYNPSSIISYCDFSKFDGHSYLELGFKKERLNKPGFWWYNQDKKEVYQRTPWKHNEYKNYLKLYDCGQLVFIWKVND